MVEVPQHPLRQDLEEDGPRRHRHAHQEHLYPSRHRPRECDYTTWLSGFVSYLWDTGELPHRVDQVRGPDFKTSYHTILGRPALARFMVIPPLRVPCTQDVRS
jgi:hypothetical protein